MVVNNVIVNFFSNDLLSICGGAMVVSLLILVLGIVYRNSLIKSRDYNSLPKPIFIIFLVLRWIQKSTVQLLGRKYSFMTPFFIYLVFYFWGTSLINMVGLKGISTHVTVPLTVSGIVFLGSILLGLVSRGRSFWGDYYIWVKFKNRKLFPILDILKILGECGKIISLGFRLWGNYFAGTLILSILHLALGSALSGLGWTSSLVLSLGVFPLHLYFDVIDGALHSLIFLLLSLSYWAMAKQVEVKREISSQNSESALQPQLEPKVV